MSPKKQAAPADLWVHKVGSRPHTLVAEERTDKGLQVYLRWSAKNPVSGKWQTKVCNTGLHVRDERGRRRRSLEDVAREAAEKAHSVYAAGGNPADWNRRTTPTGAPPRTLAEGFREALVSKDNPEHVGHLHPVRDGTALTHRHCADFIEQYLDKDTEWASIRAGHLQDLWREMIRAHKAGTGPGYRTIERTVQAFYTIAKHLGERYGDEFPAIAQPANWRTKLKRDWQRIVGENIEEVQKTKKKLLRYRLNELEKLFSNLSEVREEEVEHGRKHKRLVREMLPLCDPRVRMIVEIAAELRPGQVLRAMRSHLDLSPMGQYKLGRFHGSKLGRGHKHGEDVDLHPELRGYLEEVLYRGHLSELETARLKGVIEDYPLFPGGKLRLGKVPLHRILEQPNLRMSPSTAIWYWKDFEAKVGVPHVEDRSFYGLRRGLADKANDYSTDDRALDRLTGHSDSKTRKDIYQDRERDEDRGRAAEIRRQMRNDLSGVPGPDPTDRAQSLDEIWASLTDEQRAALLTRHQEGK